MQVGNESVPGREPFGYAASMTDMYPLLAGATTVGERIRGSSTTAG